MSYILDALRRADNERGRGVVPGIHSQVEGAAAQHTAPSRNRTLVWAVVGLSAALVAVIVWMLLRGGDAPAVRAEATAPVAVVTPAPVEPAAQPAPAPAPAAQELIVPTNPPPAVAPHPQRAAHAMPQEAPPPAPRHGRAASSQAAAQAQPAPAAKTATAGDTRVHAVNELPADIRATLPKLSIGGAMYSPNPASRMLIVNGQLMHEGEKVAPDLVLEKIELKRAVLSYRGYHYSISY